MEFYIEKLCIEGFFRSRLILKGWTSDSKSNIKINYVGNKKVLLPNELRKDVNSFLEINKGKRGFYYVIPIPFYCMSIKVKVISKDKVIYQNRINCSLFSKIYNKFSKLIKLIFKTIKILIRNPKIVLSKNLLKKYIDVFFKKYNGNDKELTYNPFDKNDYMEWIIQNEQFNSKKNIHKYNPKISIIIPVYNPNLNEFKECIESVLKQTYDNFEICVCDDCSTKSEVIEYEKELSKNKKIKVKFREENGHISRCSNTALKMATGEFIGLVDDDDLLSTNALEEAVSILNLYKNIDFIYSDNDKIDENGNRCDPYFKPDYAPDTLFSLNYLSHFNVIRKKTIEEVGGFRVGYEGAQDYDLYLRILEKTKNIYHIPKILYHWRMSKNSTALSTNKKNYAFNAGKKAIEDAIKRRNIEADVITRKNCDFYYVKYKLINKPLISIIIPTKDHADILKTCIDSVLESTYQHYEILIVDNGSKESETKKLLQEYGKNEKITIIECNCEFNFSYINNYAVEKSKGDYLLLLNNDTEIITKDFLEQMVSYASQKHVGAVGAKLLYPDKTIQHGGVVLGLGGVASHVYLNESYKAKGIYGMLECPTNYGAVTAACLMVSKKKYLEVGGLNETLKVAYNDIDFNIKLLEKGYYNVFLPDVVLYHHESKSRGLDTTGEKYKRFLFESNYMYEKWKKYIERDPFYNPNYSLKGCFRLDKRE